MATNRHPRPGAGLRWTCDDDCGRIHATLAGALRHADQRGSMPVELPAVRIMICAWCHPDGSHDPTYVDAGRSSTWCAMAAAAPDPAPTEAELRVELDDVERRICAAHGICDRHAAEVFGVTPPPAPERP
mgnify:CR=1 FL=1